MKRSIKIGKKGAVILVALIAISMVVAGALLTYYAKVDGTHEVDALWEIQENSTGTMSAWTDAEEFDITYSTTDMAPGDEIIWDFSLKLNADLDTSDIIYFIVTDDEDNGIDCQILDSGLSEITNSTHTAGQEKSYWFKLTTDEYSPADTYTVTVMMEASE